MEEVVKKSFWSLFLRGVIAVIFGLLVINYTHLTIHLLIAFFGVYFILNGLVIAVFSLVNRWDKNWGYHLLEGIINIIVGLLVVLWPQVTAIIILYLIAIWAILVGILQIIAFIQAKHLLSSELLLGFSGLLSLIVGIYLIRFPGAGAIAIAWLIGFYILIVGLFHIITAFRVRKA
jgi:uncharacterized membrane protein HdeD (DUF308 family)